MFYYLFCKKYLTYILIFAIVYTERERKTDRPETGKKGKKMSLQKIIAIEKNLKKREIDFDLHLSGLSKSAYFYFKNKNEDLITLRVSNHELPAKYETRANRHTDFSFNDKMSDIMRFVERETGKKAVRKSRDTVLVSAKDREYLEKEAKARGITVERVVEIYFAGKKVVG